MVMKWTDEDKETLRRMWEEGVRTKDIAEAIGKGATKNAVIGQAHRLGLKPHANPPNIQRKPPGEKPKRKPSKPSKVEETVMVGPEYLGDVFAPLMPKTKDAPVARGVRLVDLRERSCRFPLGDPADKDFAFCGEETAIDRVYCPCHMRICYVPNSSLRKVA